MVASFFFYDVETSGLNPRDARVMQFAGQRTDMELKPIGEPLNVLIKMTDDVLPDPQAVLATGLTPQQTLADGISEAEFLKLFVTEAAMPNTIFVGYNTVRFDDEFMRYLHYRNFYDPYEWQWQDGRGRWDLLDVVRMTRALRPEGIAWPVDDKNNPTNRLELLTVLNKLDHANAHDALSDVLATIDVARLLCAKQPKLFSFLLNLRDKKQVAVLTHTGQPFVYTSGKYPGEFEKTTVVATVAEHPHRPAALVYNLRHDPREWQDKTVEQLVEAWRWSKDKDQPRLPVKTLQFNHCPALAPLSVLDTASLERLQLDMKIINQYAKLLATATDFPAKLIKALDVLDKAQQARWIGEQPEVDAQLYDGFFDNHDRQLEATVRSASANELQSLAADFHDQRLTKLLPLYKARNFSASLTDEERSQWENFRSHRLLAGGQKSRLATYMLQLQELANNNKLTAEQQFLLEELNLWAQSVMPEPGAE